MARFYADENFPAQVVFWLRQLGHDVLTAKDAGKANQGIDDATVLADAFAQGRILLTEDRRDFHRLHNAGKPNHGIIVCTPDSNAEGYARRISAAIPTTAPQGGWVLRIRKPS